MSDKETPEGFGRRPFLKRVGGVLFGFAAINAGLISTAQTADAAAECSFGRRYRKLVRTYGQSKPICFYYYYDTYTLKFCFSEITNC